MRRADLLDSTDLAGTDRYSALMQAEAASTAVSPRAFTDCHVAATSFIANSLPSSGVAAIYGASAIPTMYGESAGFDAYRASAVAYRATATAEAQFLSARAEVNRVSATMLAAAQSHEVVRTNLAATAAIPEFTKWFRSAPDLGQSADALRSQLTGWVNRYDLHDTAVFQAFVTDVSRLTPNSELGRMFSGSGWHIGTTHAVWSATRSVGYNAQEAYGSFAQLHKGLNRRALRRLWAIAIQAIVSRRLAVAKSKRSHSKALKVLSSVLFTLLLKLRSAHSRSRAVRWSDGLTHRRVLGFAQRSGNSPPSHSPRSTEPHSRVLEHQAKANVREPWTVFGQRLRGGCIS